MRKYQIGKNQHGISSVQSALKLVKMPCIFPYSSVTEKGANNRNVYRDGKLGRPLLSLKQWLLDEKNCKALF